MQRTTKLLLGILIALALAMPSMADAAARPGGKKAMYFVQGLTGGTATDLDGLDITGAGTPNDYDLVDGDSAIVTTTSGDPDSYIYVFDADGTDAESSPDVIRPDDYSTQGVWRMSVPSPLENYDSTTLQMKDSYTTFKLKSGDAIDGVAYSIGDFTGSGVVSLSYAAGDDITFGSAGDATAGTVLLTSTTAGNAHLTLQVQDGVVDGYCVTLVAAAGVDASNNIVIDCDTDTANLGFTSATLVAVGDNATICWTGAAWFLQNLESM